MRLRLWLRNSRRSDSRVFPLTRVLGGRDTDQNSSFPQSTARWARYYKCICRFRGALCVLVTQSCTTLCDPMDCSPPGSSVHGIFQARILECVAIPFSRGSSWPRDWTQVSCIAGRFFTFWGTREAPMGPYAHLIWWPSLRKRMENSIQMWMFS